LISFGDLLSVTVVAQATFCSQLLTYTNSYKVDWMRSFFVCLKIYLEADGN